MRFRCSNFSIVSGSRAASVMSGKFYDSSAMEVSMRSRHVTLSLTALLIGLFCCDTSGANVKSAKRKTIQSSAATKTRIDHRIKVPGDGLLERALKGEARILDLSHTISTKTPTFGGETDSFRYERLSEIKKDGYASGAWRIPE